MEQAVDLVGVAEWDLTVGNCKVKNHDVPLRKSINFFAPRKGHWASECFRDIILENHAV